MQAGQEAWDRLARFRETHPVHRLDVDGLVWEYLDCGQGEPDMLVLPGGLRRAETAHAQIRMLEGSHRVITPSYPAVLTIDPIVDGLVGILDRLGIQRTSVLGQSYGGMVAQVLVRRHPERVENLILSSAGPLKGTRVQILLLHLLLALASVLPEAALKGFHRKTLRAALSVPGSERRFWDIYLKDLFARHLSKGDVVSHFRTGQDVLKRYAYADEEKSRWQGRVLIMGGERDPVSTRSDREALKDYFPCAEIRVIDGCGHTPALEKPGVYAAQILEFLSYEG
jgi:pimeloyl-ACP methyl ester carboxylesterase